MLVKTKKQKQKAKKQRKVVRMHTLGKKDHP